MNRIEKNEIIFVRLGWALITLGVINAITNSIVNFITGWELVFAAVLFLCSVALNIAKYLAAKSGKINDDRIFLVFRLTELVFTSFAAIYLEMGTLAHLFFAFTIVVASLDKGSRYGLLLVFSSFIAHSLLLACAILSGKAEISVSLIYSTLSVICFYFVLTILARFCGNIHNEALAGDKENERLLSELKEKYKQLAAAQNEIQYHFNKLKDTNCKLEESNKKMKDNIAEYYTLQQVGEAISSILDTEELLKYVNDIIIGVMGVSNCVIALYDEKDDKLAVHATNISDTQELKMLNENINCPVLLNAFENTQSILDNSVTPDKYIFTVNRNVNSLICVPLTTKSRRFGLVLVEHKHSNAFEDGNRRLLKTIGKQVGVALENAELYQRMQELATIDGLTGIHNRLYFEERLSIELQKARDEDYPLSVVMFDIDYFKRFNDTYGHLFGDKVLKAIVDQIGELLKSSEVFSRYGGEEFFIILPRSDMNETYERMEELREIIARMVIRDKLVCATVTLSFGISSYPEIASNEQELIHFADEALYQAKASGRNRVCTFGKKDYYMQGQEYLI